MKPYISSSAHMISHCSLSLSFLPVYGHPRLLSLVQASQARFPLSSQPHASTAARIARGPRAPKVPQQQMSCSSSGHHIIRQPQLE